MMLQKKKWFIPKQILTPKNVLISKYSNGLAQDIFAKYSVLRNDLVAWFELFFEVDRTFEDYNKADIGQLLINLRMQLQIQEESNESSIRISGQQILNNFKMQLESTAKTLYSSVGRQSLNYLKERLLKYTIPSSTLFDKAYIDELYKNKSRFSYIYDNPTNIQKVVNSFNFNNIRPYNAVSGALKNALPLNFNTIKGRPDLETALSFMSQRYIYGDRKAKSSFNFNSFENYNAVERALLNALSINVNNVAGVRGLESVLNLLPQIVIYGDRKAKSSFNFKSLKLYTAVESALLNALSINVNNVTAVRGLESVLNLLPQIAIYGGRKVRSSFNFKSFETYNAVERALIDALSINVNNITAERGFGSVLSLLSSKNIYGEVLKNAFSLKFRTITGVSDLGSVIRIPAINMYSKGIKNLYLKYVKDNIDTIYSIVNSNGVDGLYSNIGGYGDNYESIVHMNPYSFRNYYRLYFPGISSYIESGFKMAYIQGESIKEFSSIIHDKIVSGLRQELPETLRSAYRLGLFGVRKPTKRKQRREMDSEAKEFWHNMTYNIIQGFRRELESKTNYFFTNHIYKSAYGFSPYHENEDEDGYKESTYGHWTSQETLIHNKHAYTTHFSEQERGRITPHSIYNLRKTYPDIYNMLTFAGLLPTLYVQKHSRETAMGLLSKSIQQYYLGNRNLTVRAYDLIRDKLQTEEKGFTWPEAMNNFATMEFRSTRKAQKSSSYMEEIQALKTQVVNIEKQTVQSVHTSSVNVNSLVERVYKEIEHRIKVDRTRRGY